MHSDNAGVAEWWPLWPARIFVDAHTRGIAMQKLHLYVPAVKLRRKEGKSQKQSEIDEIHYRGN